MKHRALFLTLALFTITQHLNAQDVGTAATVSSETSSSNKWQNWVFASTALISATIGVVVVALNPGSTSH